MIRDKNFLDILEGEKLSAVTFVMDYLQLDFDGNGFTMNIWPSLVINNTLYKFGQADYRDKICTIIGEFVLNVDYKEVEYIGINFKNGNLIKLSLDPTNPELTTPEIAIFTDIDKQFWIF